MATLQRNRHSPPREANAVSQALVASLDTFDALQPIPGPKSWSDETERAAVFHCLQSSPPIMALCAAGVPHRTANEWLSDSPPERYQSACIALAARLKEAEQACAAGLFANIHKAAQDPRYWTAAAWTLERKHGFVVQQAGLTGPATVVNIGQLVIQAAPGQSLPNRQLVVDAEAISEGESVPTKANLSRIPNETEQV